MSDENSSPSATASISADADSELETHQSEALSYTSAESLASLTSQDRDIIDCHAEATVESVGEHRDADIDREGGLEVAMSCTVAAEFDTLHRKAEVGQLVESKDASVPAPDIDKVKAGWLKEVMELEEVVDVSSVEASASLPALEASFLIALKHSAIAVGSEESVASEPEMEEIAAASEPAAAPERTEQHTPVNSSPQNPPSFSVAPPISPVNIDVRGTTPSRDREPSTDPSKLADAVNEHASEGKKNKESRKNKRKRET